MELVLLNKIKKLSLFMGLHLALNIFQKIHLIPIIIFIVSCQSSKPQGSIKKDQRLNQEGQMINPNPEALKFFMNGQVLMNQGDFPMAIIEFQEALTLDPNVGTIYTAIAECYWNIGKPELSMKNLKIALSKDAKDVEALKMMADQFIAQKKFNEAIEPFKRLREIEPTEIQYIIALAELKKINRDYFSSMNLYLEAFKIEPSRLELLESAGRYALQLENKDKAKSIFKELSMKNAEQSSYLNIYSELAVQSNDYDQAILHIEELNRLHGYSNDREAKLGVLFFESGKVKKGKKILQNLLNQDRLDPQYTFSLFEMYLENSQNKEAGVIGDKMITDFPEDWRGYYSRALVYMNENNFESAISILDPVSKTFFNIFSIQYLLGLNYSRIKKNDAALEFYNQALSIQPQSISVLHSLAILYDEIGEWIKSDKIYNQLIQTDSSDAQALNNYAYSLVERNEKLNTALAYAKRAIDLEPDNPSYLDTIGWVYFKLGNLKQAKKYIEQSIEIQGNNAVVLEHLGDILMKSNDLINASSYYKKAYDIDKENLRLKNKAYPE